MYLSATHYINAGRYPGILCIFEEVVLDQDTGVDS
jgi:hypothetical protein